MALMVFCAVCAPAAEVWAETAARFPLEVPAALTHLLGQEGADLQFALVGLPNGGAAIQTSVRVYDDGPFDLYALDESIITLLDNQGRVARQFAVPRLDMNGGDIVGVLAGGELLMMRDGRGYAAFAAVTLDGAVKWQRTLNVDSYLSFPPPLATANGGIAFLDEFVHLSSCILKRLDDQGRSMKPVEMQDPVLRRDAMHIAGEFLLELSDGGFLAQCSFADMGRDIVRSLMFRIDRSGREVWQRPMHASILGGREESVGTILLLANESEARGDVEAAQPPLPGSPFGWLAIRVGLENGEILDIKQIEPSGIAWSGYGGHPAGDRVALPDGGMILSTRPSDDPLSRGPLWLTRIATTGAVVWRRPIVKADDPSDLCMHGCYQSTGIAVVDGQVLVAVNGWLLRPGMPQSGVYTVPFK